MVANVKKKVLSWFHNTLSLQGGGDFPLQNPAECRKIKAAGAGTCYVYAYAQNGVFAKCKVTVK